MTERPERPWLRKITQDGTEVAVRRTAKAREQMIEAGADAIADTVRWAADSLAEAIYAAWFGEPDDE